MEQDDHETSQEEDESIPNEYFCPITHQLMKDPVIATDGYTYERCAIERWFQGGHGRSPMTNMPLATQTLIPNQTLKNMINNLTEDQKKRVEKKDLALAYELQIQELKTRLNNLNTKEKKHPGFTSPVPFFQSEYSKYNISNTAMAITAMFHHNNFLYIGTANGSIFKFNLQSGASTLFIWKHNSSVILLHCLESSLLSVSRDGTLYCFDFESWSSTSINLTQDIIKHTQLMNENLLIFSTLNKKIILFDIKQRCYRQTIDCKSECRFLEKITEQSFAAGFYGGYIETWNLTANNQNPWQMKACYLMPWKNFAIASPIITMSQHQLIVAESDDQNFRINRILPALFKEYRLYRVDLANDNIITLSTGHKGSIEAMIMSRNKKYIITGSQDGSIKIWHSQTHDFVKEISLQQDFAKCLLQLEDGQIVYGTNTGNLYIHKIPDIYLLGRQSRDINDNCEYPQLTK